MQDPPRNPEVGNSSAPVHSVVGSTGSDLLVACLIESGVRTIFGLPGDTGVALYDALYRHRGTIRHVLARDERNAAFMADGFARASNTVGVVEVSSGGGTTYVVGGLGESFAASVPLLVITSDIQADSRGTGALTEIDQVALFKAVTKWQRVVESADEIPGALTEALRSATSGRPAPVVLIVPENVLDERTDAVSTPSSAALTHLPGDRPAAADDAVSQAVALLVAAQRPAIVAGSGVHISAAWDNLAALANRLAVPVATTIQGKGSISTDSPWSLGVVGGNGGNSRANSYLRRANPVLLIGTRGNATDTDGWSAPPRTGTQVIGLDIDRARAGRNFPGSLSLVGDASTILGAMLAAAPPITPARRRGRLELISDAVHPDQRSVSAGEGSAASARSSVAGPHEGDAPLSAADVIDALARAINRAEHIVIADPGTPTPYVADRWPVHHAGRTVLAPRGHGPMGYAIPAAIGAALARPTATVIAVTADGGFAMSCGELETVHRLGLSIIYVQLTNNSLGWIKMLQHLYTGRRYFDVDPGPIDSVMVARACGLDAARVHSITCLQTRVADAIRDRRSIYIDVPVRHLIDEVPPVSSWHAALAGNTARPAY